VQSSYTLTWDLAASAEIDALTVYENGAMIARIEPEARTFTSPHPASGRLLVEVVAERDGHASRLRASCIVQNTTLPVFPQDEVGVEPAVRVRDFRMSACAVTKTPLRPGDFRAFLVGRATNTVEIFDHHLVHLETLELTPSITKAGINDAALGIALVETEEGDRALAILDSDGADGKGSPHIDFHALDKGPTGEPAGRRLYRTEAIDLSELPEEPFLFDIDIDSEGHFIAGGRLSDGRFVIVRLIWDQSERIVRAVAQADAPFAQLSPSGESHGIGVSVLPNDYLLVVGGDVHQRSYSEAILMTPFRDETSDGQPRFVGFAAGMPRPGAFFASFGPEFGPGLVFSLATAWFGEEVGSVCYLPTVDVELVSNPATREVLQVNADLFIQARADEELGHPGLVADQVLEERFSLGTDPRGSSETFSVPLSEFVDLDSPDLVLYLINESLSHQAKLSLAGQIDGDTIDTLPGEIEIEPGRYYRVLLEDMPGSQLDLWIGNTDDVEIPLQIYVGARGVDPWLAPGIEFFRRGDCDTDGQVNITDGIFALGHLFSGGDPTRCLDACDTDDNGAFNLSDAVATLQYLFQSMAAPPDPGPLGCGVDPTLDQLAPCEYDVGGPGCR